MFRKLVEADFNKTAQESCFEYAGGYLTRTARLLTLRGTIAGYPYRSDFSNPTAVGDDILALNIEDKTIPIVLLIDSPGGEVFSGFNLYDIIRSSEAPIITVGQTVASMAIPVFLAGSKRYALPHSRFMLHLPRVTYIGQTLDAEELRIHGNLLQDIKESLVECYIERGVTAGLKEGASKSQIRKKILIDIDRDVWFTAKDAQAYGLVEEILHRQNILQIAGSV